MQWIESDAASCRREEPALDQMISVFRYEGEKDESFVSHYRWTLTAYETARRAHEGQKDKGGRPYFYHPLSVCHILNGVSAYDPRLLTDAFFETPIYLKDVRDCDLMSIALLHDVLEDTSVTGPKIRNLFGDEIAEAVLSVTRREGEDYMDFIARAKQNPIGRTVKLADLYHNMDLSRIPDPQPRDFERLEKYRQAEKLLLS